MAGSCQSPPSEKPAVTVAEILREYAHTLTGLSPEQWRVIRAITRCRTRLMGGRMMKCRACGEEFHLHNSCRNRHCPVCQGAAREEWVRGRLAELLPVSYFHVVFTISEQLRPIALRNKRILYGILFRAASETLLEVSRERLGAEIGALAVLHTWGQNLLDHPHLHFVVTGGGLSSDGAHWVDGGARYFLPVKVLSIVFRGKFLEMLEQAFGSLRFPGAVAEFAEKGAFDELLRRAARKPWVVYAKAPFGGPAQVIAYLGRYTHRVAITNKRLIGRDGDRVTIRRKDYADGGVVKEMTLEMTEFARRFLLHVLPRGFKRIRMYGIWGNRVKKAKLARCRELIAAKDAAKKAEMILAPGLAVHPPRKPACPHCGCEELIETGRFPRPRPVCRTGRREPTPETVDTS